MKYLCLIYDEEKNRAAMSKSESDALIGEYVAFNDGIRKSGHYFGGEALQFGSDRHDPAGPER